MQKQTTSIDVKSMSLETLAGLFQEIFCADTQVVNQSTAVLKKYFELPTCIKPMIIHATTHADQRVRLLSCICLRKRLPQHWVAQSPDLQTEIKTALLNHYIAEPVSKVKENVAYAISALATILVPNNEWPELFAFVTTKCQSANVQDKELGALLLFAMTEALGNTLGAYLPTIIELLGHLISVQYQPVQRLAVKTVNCITISNISSEKLPELEGLIPVMIKTVMGLSDNDALMHEILENLIELIEVPKFLQAHVPFLVSVSLAIGKNKTLSPELRKIALCFVESVALYKAKLVKKDRATLMSILEAAFEIASENEDDFDKEEDTPVDAALTVIQEYAVHIPNAIIFPLIIKGCEAFVKSPEPLKRRASLLILGEVSKGVQDPIKNDLDEIVTSVLQSMSDPSPLVQEACVLALCYFSENLSPEIVAYHSQILPVLLQAFGTKTEKIRNKVFYALEMFCENLLEHEIQPYLHPLLACLVGYLDSPQLYPSLS